MIDTCRILITLDCNFRCSYCCNELPEIQEQFIKVNSLEDIPWNAYQKVCISGGEPMLRVDRLDYVLYYTRAHRLPVYLYTNGLFLYGFLIDRLIAEGVTAVNIGWHGREAGIHRSIFTHPKVRVTAIEGTPVPEWLEQATTVRRVPLNVCETPNEHLYIWREDD